MKKIIIALLLCFTLCLCPIVVGCQPAENEAVDPVDPTPSPDSPVTPDPDPTPDPSPVTPDPDPVTPDPDPVTPDPNPVTPDPDPDPVVQVEADEVWSKIQEKFDGEGELTLKSDEEYITLTSDLEFEFVFSGEGVIADAETAEVVIPEYMTELLEKYENLTFAHELTGEDTYTIKVKLKQD